MIRAQQPGSQPIDIPETIPNPAVVPVQPVPAPSRPAPQEPVKTPEMVPANWSAPLGGGQFQAAGVLLQLPAWPLWATEQRKRSALQFSLN